MKKEKWYYVHIRNACFGFQTINDKVIKVAPIGRWMMGKHISEVSSIIKRKGGEFFNIGEDR